MNPRNPRTPPLYHAPLDAASATGALLVAVASFYLCAGLQRPGLAQLASAELVLAAVSLAAVARHQLRAQAERPVRATLAAVGLVRPSTRALAAALLIGVSAWLPNLHLALWLTHFLGSQARVAGLERLLQGPELALTLTTLAIAPALAEELAFRGLWARALSPRVGAIGASALSAIAFGSYHLSVAQWAPTTVLGALLAWSSLRSGSLWTSIILHATNNAVAGLLAAGKVGRLARWMELYPSASVALAVTSTLTGLSLLAFERRAPRRRASERETL